MEYDKFVFKKTGNPRVQVGGNGHCCTGYYSIGRLLCDFSVCVKEHCYSSPLITRTRKQTIIQYV